MKAPVRFATGNLVFGRDPDDVWALYRLDLTSYEGLTVAQKKQLLSDVASFAYGIEADFSLLRVTRAWSPEEYARYASIANDPRHGHPGAWDRYVAGQLHELAARGPSRAEVFLSVRLAAPAQAPLDAAAATAGRWLSSPRCAWRELRDGAGLADPTTISEARLREVSSAEQRAHARVFDFLAAERATTLDVQWLIRRAFCRGVAEPALDVFWRPQALVVKDGDQLAYRPHEADVLRLFRSPLTVEDRGLLVQGETGESHQALLCLGALPETVSFPGRGAELLFAPLEAAGFPVDAVFSAQWVPNDAATRLVRRRVIDADNEETEQLAGDHGPSPEAARRPLAARALEEYLTGESHPPLLCATVALAVGASTAEERERRVEVLRREYAPITLERPTGDQLRLFCQFFPGQPTQLADYEDHMLVEQLGAMVPTATHAVGADCGPYLGRTLSGSQAPVCFDVTEACRSSYTPAILLVGPPGRGKTVALQRLLYERFLQGSRIIDVDPKPDHRWTELPDVADHVETIEFRADPRYRGLLDPLRIAPAEDAEDLAVDWLCSLLRSDIPHTWETEIRAAVKQVLARASAREASCGHVLAVLEAGNDDARQVARGLSVFADSGLAQLGFAAVDAPAHHKVIKQVTALRVAGLALPEHGTAVNALGARERTSQALMALVATYALQLMASDPAVHTVLGFDEAWVLTDTPAGRRLLRRANRLGRAQNGTPLLGTQNLSDVDDELKELIGAVFAFGAETETEARRTLAMLDVNPDDTGMRQKLMSFRQGRCFLRDYQRRLGAVQIDFDHAPDLLEALRTDPGRPGGPRAQAGEFVPA